VTAASPARRRQRLLSLVTFVVCLLPLAWIGFKAAMGGLGANPVAAVLNDLGFWTLTTLVAALACTPLKLVAGWNWPLRVRRMLGLFAFFYGTAHLATYVVVDQGLDVGEILDDLVKRKFITLGFAAWTLLLPLALTSTNGWVKRLGFRQWKRLHRLGYLVAAIGIVHYQLRFKVLETHPLIFGSVWAALMLVRVVEAVRGRVGKPAPAEAPTQPSPEGGGFQGP
jgi:sulfoxide reductase heme-binding subunit YedZ